MTTGLIAKNDIDIMIICQRDYVFTTKTRKEENERNPSVTRTSPKLTPWNDAIQCMYNSPDHSQQQ